MIMNFTWLLVYLNILFEFLRITFYSLYKIILFYLIIKIIQINFIEDLFVLKK